MIECKATDKLAVLGTIVDKMLDKIPDDKITQIKSLKIDWDDMEYSDDPLPTLKIEFHK